MFDLSKFKKVPEPFENVHTSLKIIISLLASLTSIILGTVEGLGCLFLASAVYVSFIQNKIVLLYAYIAGLILFGISACFLYVLTFVIPMGEVSFFSVLSIPYMRMLIMMNVLLPLALSTRVQNILTSLKSMRLPFIIYLPAAIMIRFVPTFLNDIKQISETLKIRGFALSASQVLHHPFLTLRFVFTPLIFRSLRTSEDLGIAGDLKGLSPYNKISAYKKEIWNKLDTYLLTLVFLVVVSAFLVEIYLGTDVVGGH